MAETGAPNVGGSTGLRAKMYGLPVWGWIALAGAASVVAVVWWQHRKSATPPPATTPTDTSQFAGPDTGQWEALMTQIRDLQGAPSQPASGGATSKYASNDEWEQAALAWWAKNGYKETTPLHAQIALNDYLQGGKTLGAWEWWIVNTTINGGNVKGWNSGNQVTFPTGVGPPPNIPQVKV